MGSQERQQKEKMILETSVKLFIENGFQATKMEDVAKACKISKGLTYFYFKNKEDLYMAISKKAFDELKDIFREILKSKERNGLEMLVELSTKYVKFANENRMYYEAILNFLGIIQLYNDETQRQKIHPLVMGSDHFQKLLNIHGDCAKLGTQMIILGMKDGSVRPDLKADATFYTIWALLIGYERLLGPIGYDGKDARIDLETMKSTFQKLLQDMLKGTFQTPKAQPVQGSLF